MTFDPFGDFATRGYLRNRAGERDRAIVRRMEHAAFTTGLDAAFEALSKRAALTYNYEVSAARGKERCGATGSEGAPQKLGCTKPRSAIQAMGILH